MLDNERVTGFQIGSLARRDLRGWGRIGMMLNLFEKCGRGWGCETGTTWRCDVRLRCFEVVGLDGGDAAFLGDDARILQFAVDCVA